MEAAIALPPFERHPVAAILREQCQPFLKTQLVQQARLADDKVDEIMVGWECHGAAHMLIVMNFDHARNWLRICHSVVPLVTAVVTALHAAAPPRPNVC